MHGEAQANAMDLARLEAFKAAKAKAIAEGWYSDDWAERMARGYMECALFTSQGPEGGLNIPETSGEFNAEPYMKRISKATMRRALIVCETFALMNAESLGEYKDKPERCGHDLWYTQNGHGCGFWEADHCTKAEGEALTEAAKRIGEREVYRNDGGWIELQ